MDPEAGTDPEASGAGAREGAEARPAGGAEAKKTARPWERVAPLSEAVIQGYFERGLNLSASW